MTIAILEPFSGIAGDMTLGALVDVGLDEDWLRSLPGRLGLQGVAVRISRVRRAGIDCAKVEFDIPPQPHGRHLRQIREIVQRSDAPEDVKRQADEAFTAIATVEASIHGVPVERVHLHEVGAVDAILDVVGSIWGFRQLGISEIFCSAISTGDGTVNAAHGTLPVPAPATLRLLEGLRIRRGPEGSGELVTPTGAALVRVLSRGEPPPSYVVLRSGYGAGTKDFPDRPNALRVILADVVSATGDRVEELVLLAADVDDMEPEYLAGAAETLRSAGALDVVLFPSVMKKGRPGARIEVLARPGEADALERALFAETTTIGVRRAHVRRHALSRETRSVDVRGHAVRMKIVAMPDGARRVKPEYDDVARLAEVTGITLREAVTAAREAAERVAADRVFHGAGAS
ncbi:MAG TPA: nickel pincer cofactor biosynthesis protein LarC [Gemmatimonadaceae bacterium]|nr:nickel pincer cofactor biosynthesis protein LarC [Gemmatimonadaceae bacterium]